MRFPEVRHTNAVQYWFMPGYWATDHGFEAVSGIIVIAPDPIHLNSVGSENFKNVTTDIKPSFFSCAELNPIGRLDVTLCSCLRNLYGADSEFNCAAFRECNVNAKRHNRRRTHELDIIRKCGQKNTLQLTAQSMPATACLRYAALLSMPEHPG